MAIPAMISEMGQQQLNYGAAVGQSLIALGQQVGQQLATREYQRQAQAALPALQQTYSSALDKIQAGDVSAGYRDLMNAQLQFGATQNPFLTTINDRASKLAEDAANNVMKTRLYEMQYGGRGGGGGGGGTGVTTTGATQLPAMTAKGAAAQAMGMNDGGQPPTGVNLNEPPQDIVNTGLSPDEEAAANLPTTQEPEALSEGQISTFIESVAESAKTKEFRDALRKAKESPASVKTREDLMKYVNAYNGLSQAQQDEQQALFTNTFASTDEMRRSLPEKSGFTELKEAESIIGPGIKGIVFKESVIPTGARVSEGGATSASFGTNREQIETQRNLLTGAIVELSKGKIGKFFKESGGIYKVDISRDEDNQPILQDKNNPERTLVIPADDYNAINSSFTTIKKIIPQFQYLKDAGGQAAFVSVRTGPTKETAAQITPTEPQKRRVKVLQDRGGRYYLNAKGQKVYLKK